MSNERVDDMIKRLSVRGSSGRSEFGRLRDMEYGVACRSAQEGSSVRSTSPVSDSALHGA
jgi:hypothetical protein